MPRLNTIDLNRSFKNIAADLGQRGKQELRAKLVDGKMVLYSKKVGPAGRVLGNLFHDRAKKRSDAREFVMKKFEFLPGAEKGQVLSQLRLAKRTASRYKEAFNLAATFDLAFRDLEAAPKDLGKFLTWAHRDDFLPALRKLAQNQQMTAELDFVENLDSLSSRTPQKAAETAKSLCEQLLSEELNVLPDKLKALAKALGIPWESRTTPPTKWTEKLHPMPSEVQQALLACRAELVKDMNHAFYLPLLNKKINSLTFV